MPAPNTHTSANPDPSTAPAELFRLVALRAPQPATGSVSRITISGSAGLAPATRLAEPQNLRSYRDTGVDQAVPLAALNDLLLKQDDAVAPDEIRAWVKKATGTDVDKLVKSEKFTTLRASLHDSLLHAVAPNEDSLVESVPPALAQTREDLLRAVRLMSLLEALAVAGTLQDANAVHTHLRYAIVVLPAATSKPADNLARAPIVADLKVVKLGAPRYEPGAIAHIENVMGFEKRERTHRLLEQMETTQTSVTERIAESEQELGTQSQVDMQQETAQLLQESTDLEVGAHVSASYGPSVSVELDSRVARHTSSEESSRAAATFSSQIVKRARERLVERSSETRVVRRLLETEETNVHGFENTRADNVTGIYRWVDSVQDAWIENYGKRLMLEFLIPEPAAFLKWAVERGVKQIDVGPPPTTPRNPNNANEELTPAHIAESNYQQLTARYGASDVPIPPAPSVELGITFKGEPDEDLFLFHDSSKLTVPKGYRATSWEAHCVTWGKVSPDGAVWMASVGSIGGINEDNTPNLKKVLGGTLNAEEGSVLPVLMLGRGLINLSAAARVHCDLTDAGRAAWKMRVYDAIMKAYQQQLENWQVAKARAEAQAMGDGASPLDGAANPVENRGVERRELRRAVVQMLLGFPPDQGIFGQDAVVPGTDTTRPELDLAVAAEERDPIAFLEQSFEWGNMMWVHYPYYWASKDRWAEDCRRSGADPLWTAFLSAGASRVVVPVRPGFESAMALYLGTGVIWSGGQVPTVGDPAYLGIAEEMAEALGTGTVPLERIDLDPVRLPTSLVWLQASSDLNPGA